MRRAAQLTVSLILALLPAMPLTVHADNSTQQTLINQDRAAAGLPPLAWSTCLAQVALQNAQRIAAQGYLSHTDGPTLDLACGIGSTQSGENIAYLSSGIDDAQANTMFMNSAPHRANILGPYNYVATAWVIAPNGYAYIAEEFLAASGLAPTALSGPTYYFPWYDLATAGFQSDYFAVGNPGPNWANVLIQLPGATPLSVGVPHGAAKYLSFPRGTIGGPVTVSTDGEPVVVSQRMVYDQSFSEQAAVPATGLATSWSFPWYDWATAGFASDYLYVANPGATTANVTISLAGAASLHLGVPAGAARYASFPRGTIGGPVTLSSDQPVLATQRVLYGNSFSEIAASAAGGATQLGFPWYDWASPDFQSDYVYVANPGAMAANVTMSLAAAASLHLSVPAGAARYASFPHGTIGGPVTLSSDQPVLAAQRSLFDGSFAEVEARPLVQAASSAHFPWYDWASPDLQSDYVYVANPGPNWANVVLSLPGAASLSFGVPHGTTTAVSFPRWTLGGPVTVTTDGEPVLISQRTVFDRAFQEFPSPASF
jgi:cysteine-rich secretory family protein